MKLSISNIAWDKENNDIILEYISKKGFKAIEIAPTTFFENNPYEHLNEMNQIYKNIKEKYNLDICSMQSIWYGKTGNIFDKKDSSELLNYTKKAIDFAKIINCKNLVFGCPKNRVIPENKTVNDIINFFKELGDYAYENDTVLSIEANPKIYSTNFINYTNEAFDFVKMIKNKGIKVNVDLGTIIENNEDLKTLEDNIDLINHIHISEPYLEIIKEREIHKDLANILKSKKYNNYISVEMKKNESIEELKKVMDYIYETFG